MMDSARDFDLLGESVPQVQISAHTLALLGFFNFSYIHVYIYAHAHMQCVIRVVDIFLSTRLVGIFPGDIILVIEKKRRIG